MPDHKSIYSQEAQNYQRLVGREDYQGNILKAIRGLMPIEGIDVVETGAGTGRLTCLLAPYVRSIQAFDSSDAMLDVARDRLTEMGQHNWSAGVADHRGLPAADACADLAISGWSVCYLVDWNRGDWKPDVAKALSEMQRVLRSGGKIVLIETQGTGFETPHPPQHLLDYYEFLKEQGFENTWFRSDYEFESIAEARELTEFFFGKELADQFSGRILPECTGIWWK
ncbi:MAG: class I SAM-dependent methyltransferase [Anaerolineaceae bacterium]|nr:class I SAM-dependent methyltransferase [Anaerolineaceae bacterium]